MDFEQLERDKRVKMFKFGSFKIVRLQIRQTVSRKIQVPKTLEQSGSKNSKIQQFEANA